jgi:hypothetical protein
MGPPGIKNRSDTHSIATLSRKKKPAISITITGSD